tara:strand:- start:270 stop:896 length:627 start_codon:yes stop_codon:yes gene_type:complete
VSLFDSIEDFARYIEEKYLLPNNFKITEIEKTEGRHPTHYAKVKFDTDKFEDEETDVFANNLVLVEYIKIRKKLKEVSIKKEYFTQWDDESKQETLLRMEKFYDTNHLYFNGKDVIMYITSIENFTPNELFPIKQGWIIWVLNLSAIEEKNYELSEKESALLWLNEYATMNYNYLNDSGGEIIYKIPIDKISKNLFMNWKKNPLGVFK